MKGYGVFIVVLLVGMTWLFGAPVLVGAGKKPASEKPRAVEKPQAKAKPFLAQWWRNKKNRERLGITKDQVQSLEAVLKDMAAKRKALNQRLKKAQEEFNRLMSRGKFNSPQVKQVTDDMVAARTGLIRNRIKASVSISEILTPAQLEQILKKDPKAFHYERPFVGRKKSGNAGKRAQK